MGLRQRIADALMGDERRKLEDGLKLVEDAYLRGPYVVTPDHLAQSLKETDATQLYDLIRRLEGQYTLAGGYGEDDTARQWAVNESRNLWKWDVIAQWVVWLWTNYGFGQTISLAPNDLRLAEVWNEFWDSDDNEATLADDNLAVLSETLLVDGEVYLAFFVSTVDGSVTVRIVRTDEITEIISDPEDEQTQLYYKREHKNAAGDIATLYYADYLALINGWLDRAVLPDDAARAEDQRRETTVLMMHLAYNKKSGARGWPIYTAGSVWSRAHTRFREDRASVAASVAMYVNKLKVSGGGQRAVDALKTKLQSSLSTSTGYPGGYDTNPPAVAGSTFIQNAAADLERLPLGSGASDAREDGHGLLLMAGLGGGLYPHYVGAGDAYRLATATAMEGPVLRQWSRYQQFWGSTFRRMLRIVAWAAETYGGADAFDDLSAEVSTDKLVEDDLAVLTQALGVMLRDGLQPFANMMPEQAVLAILETMWRTIMQALGVDDVDEILKPEWFQGGLVDDPDVPSVTMPASELHESHAGELVEVRCPLDGCAGATAWRYPDHGGLLVCAECGRTFDPALEVSLGQG